LEYREGKGMLLFCQMDVTGRTEIEPVAEILTQNILRYAFSWKPIPSRDVLYAGESAGKSHLEAAGVSIGDYTSKGLSVATLLIVGPGAGKKLTADATVIAKWLGDGGHILAIGLDAAEAEMILPTKVSMKKAEHIAAYFEPPGKDSFFTGLGP